MYQLSLLVTDLYEMDIIYKLERVVFFKGINDSLHIYIFNFPYILQLDMEYNSFDWLAIPCPCCFIVSSDQ